MPHKGLTGFTAKDCINLQHLLGHKYTQLPIHHKLAVELEMGTIYIIYINICGYNGYIYMYSCRGL